MFPRACFSAQEPPQLCAGGGRPAGGAARLPRGLPAAGRGAAVDGEAAARGDAGAGTTKQFSVTELPR